MKMKGGLIAAAALGMMLAGCATSGTSANATSDAYKKLAHSQQWYCGSFSNACTCSIDGMKTTCSLVYSCVHSGNCTTVH